MLRDKIIQKIKTLTGHPFVVLTTRGNAAIDAALSVLPKNKTVLIPEEGGWIHYSKGPQKLGLKVETVKCHEAVIDLPDLQQKVATKRFSALLYQNPGGYFAEQPLTAIYEVCNRSDCLVILDVSGAIGTPLWDRHSADILVGSFGEGKLVNANVGGFISCRDTALFEKIKHFIPELTEESSLKVILEKLNEVHLRIEFLTKKRKKILTDLQQYDIVHKNDLGFVIVIKFSTAAEKEKIINYCQKNQLSWTECPRSIRLNEPAVSIEVKKLSEEHQ